MRVLWLSFVLLAPLLHAADEFQTNHGPVIITPVQHASLTMQGAGQVIQVDPVGTDKYANAPAADLILITDIHGDHLDPAAISKLKKQGTKIVAPAAAASQLPDAIVMKNGDSRQFGPWRIEAVPMYNLKRGPEPGKFYHEKGRGNGYILTFGGKRFYIAGDTEAIPEMKNLKNIDVAFVPMNLPYTMAPEEAAEAVRAFKPKVVYPYHYRGSDLKAFQTALGGTGIEVRIRDWYK